jgi:hypothetical protein
MKLLYLFFFTFTFPFHNMFRPQSAIIRCFTLPKLLYRIECHSFTSHVSQSQTYTATDGRSYLLLLDSYGLVFMGRPFWRDDGSVFCICYWPSPAQSFSGLSPLELATIFYCLRFETSLFVASDNSQGHGGGIRPHLHTDDYFTCILMFHNL